MSCGGEQSLGLSALEQTDTGRERRLSASTAARPVQLQHHPCFLQDSAAGSGLSCSGLHPRGLHGPGRAGKELPLGLKSEQEQSHVATGTQVATVQNAQIPLHPLASLFDRSLLCLTGCWGRCRRDPRTQQPLRTSRHFPCFKARCFQFCMPIPAGYQQVPTSHLASGSSSFPEATATQNSTCRLERSSEKKQRTARLDRGQGV